MSKIVIFIIIYIIKFYKYFISHLFGNSFRYLPSCSEYMVEALKTHGVFKGLLLGSKRIVSCHPLKFLGGGSGLDFVPNKKIKKKEL